MVEHDGERAADFHARFDPAGDDGAALVLVVASDAGITRQVTDALAPRYRVATAADGREALAAARRARPHLIVCDVGGPTATADTSGDELIVAVRTDRAVGGTPILVLARRATDASRLPLLRTGAHDYLVTPFADDELRARADSLVALRLGEDRAHALRVSDDRDRIARDLHDVVIQRLFAIGMRLDAVQHYEMHPAVQSRIAGTIDDLDLVIRDIRSTIFDLQRGAGDDGLRSAAMTLTVDAAAQLGCSPRITFTGPVDSLVPEHVAANLLAVLQEALSNAVRHSLASAVEVAIEARADEVVLTVSDDGVGPADTATAGEGLRNMTARSASLGGTCTVRPRRPMGTEVRWSVPLGP